MASAHTPPTPRSKKVNYPPDWAPSLREIYENAVKSAPARIQAAISRKLRAGDPRHIQLAAAYVDGLPVQRLQVEKLQQIQVIISLPDGSRVPLPSAPLPATEGHGDT